MDKLLTEENPETITLRVRDYGFKLARFRLLPPSLQIDLENARLEGGQLVYNLEQEKPAITSQLNLDFDELSFLQNNLRINFEQKAVKTVNIESDIRLNFSIGYSALEEMRLEPDTIRVSGPSNILDTLTAVRTESIRINNINSNLKGTVRLDKTGMDRVTFFQDEVNYSLRTDKFTEGRIEIPIELQNVPKGNISVFPKEVVVFYQVSLNDFDKIKPSSFKVVVDFKNEIPEEGYLLAQVVQKPDLVNNVRLSENRIQFVVKR